MSMEIKDFYKKYNLNKYTFAQIAGVGSESLTKFEEGKQIPWFLGCCCKAGLNTHLKKNIINAIRKIARNPLVITSGER